MNAAPELTYPQVTALKFALVQGATVRNARRARVRDMYAKGLVGLPTCNPKNPKLMDAPLTDLGRLVARRLPSITQLRMMRGNARPQDRHDR